MNFVIISANSQAKSGRKADKRYLTDNMLYVLWYLSHGLLQIPTVCTGDQSDWDPKGVIFIMSRWRSWLPQPTISLGFLCHSVLEWIWIKSHIKHKPGWPEPGPVNPTQTRGVDYAPHTTTSPPGFKNISTPLCCQVG